MTYGCCAPGIVVRRYWSKEEKARWLKDYAEELEGELRGVRERIAELEKP